MENEKKMPETDLSGELVVWENEIWYADNSDIEMVDDDEPSSYFLLPAKYADTEENDKLFRSGKTDKVGYWVHRSDVYPINSDTYKRLIEKAKEANTAYYDNDEPIMPDYEYDKIMRTVKAIEKEHPELVTEDSPTQYVGGTASKSSFAKVEHAVPMLSLRDVFSFEELDEFLDRFPENETFSVQEKIDGLSMSVTYKNGVMVRAETRGDGFIGEDVTENARFVSGIPQKLRPFKGGGDISLLEVRCEVYMPIEEFLRVNENNELAGKRLFANPRNAAAGILRTKDLKTVRNANLSAFVFEVQRYETLSGSTIPQLEKISESLPTLKTLGFKCVTAFDVSRKDVRDVIGLYGRTKESLPYWIDGAVIKVNEKSKQETLGTTSKYPLWAVAYKYPPKEKETIIRDIILQTGRTGRITPVAVFDPVYLAGTKVEKATLHNPEIIAELGVNIGDTVLVRKAAEIIPEVVKVVKKRCPETATAPPDVYDVFRHNCPSCGGLIVPGTDENGSNPSGAYCVNPECPAQISRRFEFWASRDCMDIKGFGPAVIDKFIEKGWLRSIPDIYKLSKHRNEMLEIDGMGAKKVDNLLAAIENSKKNDIDRLIKALGLPGIGRHIGKELAKRYPGFYAIETLPLHTLSEIDGIGDVSAQVLYSTFQDPNFRNMIVELCCLGVNMKSLKYNEKRTSSSLSSSLSGLSFVITGTLPSLKREEAEKIIEENGGKISNSVSKKTDFLLCGEKAGSKLKKAKELGIKILSEDDFKKMINK